MASATRAKVLVIGWDCAPPKEVFELWRPSMPNLDALMRRGAFGTLRSTDPPITVPAWSSMLSSQNPGRLGFFGFRNRTVGTYDDRYIATSRAVRVPRVWDLLSDVGKRCCVLNVPQTYPVAPINGVMVSSFLTPSTESQYTYPDGLKPEIERVADGYVIDCDNFRSPDKHALLDRIYEMTHKRFAVAKYLLSEQGPWDLFMMVYMGPDRLHHGFWKYADPQHRKYEPGNPFESSLQDYYRLLDEQLGTLCQMAGPDATVLVVSDHGAKRMEGSFSVNEWLMREGLLTLKTQPEGPTRFDEALVDWEQTAAWAWGGYHCRVFLNVAGREPQGTIAPGEFESLRDDLIRRLEAIPDDRGRKMATRALRPEEIYNGPHVKAAPDLTVYFDDLYWRAGQDIGRGGLYSQDTEIGPDDCVHDYDGLYVYAPPGERGGRRVDGRHLMDIAPTVLRALGQRPTPQMEGKAIEL